MITLIEYTEGFEPLWDVVSDGKYLGHITWDTFDGYINALGNAGTPFEIVRG